jgi:hypothetical protein
MFIVSPPIITIPFGLVWSAPPSRHREDGDMVIMMGILRNDRITETFDRSTEMPVAGHLAV